MAVVVGLQLSCSEVKTAQENRALIITMSLLIIHNHFNEHCALKLYQSAIEVFKHLK